MNTANVIGNGMYDVFQKCSNLTTIYVDPTKWSTAGITNLTAQTNIFNECSNLEGGNGTKYNSTNKSNATYARVDGGASSPGYFTDIAAKPATS